MRIRIRLWLPATLVFVWCVVALSAHWLPIEPNKVTLSHILHPPSAAAWLGYDDLGRPLAQRLIAGAQISFIVAISVLFISATLGSLLGLIGAWFGGIWDRGLVFLIDVFMAFPGILLAITLAGLLGPGLNNTVLALSVTGWVGFARLARIQTLSCKEKEHIDAARVLSSSTPVILFRHILPLILAPLLIEASFAVTGIVIAEASLSFLGLGVQPPMASWGGMIRDGTRYMLIAPHVLIAPASAVFLVVISINLLGDHLRDVFDVKSL